MSPSLPDVRLIAAVSRDGFLADETGRIPWHVPRDISHFRSTVAHGQLLVGRKTAEQMRGWFAEVPCRPIILSTQKPGDGFLAHTRWAATPAEALEMAGHETLWICGGGQIYSLFLPYAQQLILSEIGLEIFLGICFPKVDYTGWSLLTESAFPSDQANGHDLHIRHWQRCPLPNHPSNSL